MELTPKMLYGPTEWFGLIAAQAVKRLGLRTTIGHLDSTSLHTDGAYADSDADDDEPVIRVTHGYNRDHRPDLKQVMTQFIDISVLHVSSLKTFVVGLTTAPKALLTLLADR